MPYIDSNGNYPVGLEDILSLSPDFLESGVLPDGWNEVYASQIPEHTPLTHRAKELYPVLINGEYFQNWEIVELEPVSQESLDMLLASGVSQEELERFYQ